MMNRLQTFVLSFLACIGLSLIAGNTFWTTAQTNTRVKAGFETQKVADGVYALIRQEPLGLWFEANVVCIINDNDVIVVDTNISTASAKESISALKKITSNPVRYVINTHWHEDHVIGNQAWREAYPGVEFIGHASTLTDFPKVGLANRKQAIEGGPRLIKLLQDQLSKNKSLTGGDLDEEERIGYSETIRLIDRYVKEAPEFQVVLPTLTIEDKLTLQRNDRTIEIRHLGKAHTAADLIVYLPKENIVVTGDLVVWPVPLVGSTSYPIDYLKTLENLLALRPAIMIPGHGPVMRDDSHVRLMIRMLASLKQQVDTAVA
ncbi:MAG TPA: MBL fold metallo-hydrolase, partial [Blastocatellia bacterium]|nr:MBL fold metallo-hydrolase [Blastocatellia bacterium]